MGGTQASASSNPDPAPPGGDPKATPAQKKAKEDAAVKIRVAKTKITRRLGKANDFLRIFNAQPAPSMSFLVNLRDIKASLEEALGECEQAYGDIILADPSNFPTYQANCDEQFERCRKALDYLAATILQIEVDLQAIGGEY